MIGLIRVSVPLTDLQRDILRMTAEGLGNREIAHRLNRSVSTVNGHLRIIFAKLGVTNRIDAWRALGWLEPPSAA